jgi:hypothetical protein
VSEIAVPGLPRLAAMVAAVATVTAGATMAGSSAPRSTGVAAFAQSATGQSDYLAKGEAGLFELRIYGLKQGMTANTFKFMSRVTAFQNTVGMSIIGHFPDLDASKYIWFRQYPNEKTRTERFRAVYDSEVWKSGTLRGGLTDTGIVGSNVYLATATRYSKLQYPFAPTHESSAMGPSAKELGSKFAASPDGQAPSCGPCGNNPVIFEVTLHDVKPGLMDSYTMYMGEQVFAKQEAAGIRVFAQLVPYAKVTSLTNGGATIPENSTFISIRLFADEATRNRQLAKLGEDEHAAAKAAQAAGRAGLNTIVLSGHPTFYSPMQQ